MSILQRPRFRAMPCRAGLAQSIRMGFYCLLIGMAVWLMPGCQRNPASQTTVRVTGASTVYPIVQMAGEALRQQQQLNIEAQAGGSTRGYEDTVAGRNDMGPWRGSCCRRREHVKAFPIAYDGVGIVVHASNAVTGVTTAQFRQIYRKENRNWASLGGAEGEIVVVTKAEGHATLETFLNHTGLDRSELQVDVVGGDNAQVIRVVANTPDAIGFVSMGEVIHAIEIGMSLRLIKRDGVEPTLDRVADKSFPMYRTLYLIAKSEPQGGSRILLDYLHSDAGKALIKRGKYVPLS